jgi:predicted transcriptional regulator
MSKRKRKKLRPTDGELEILRVLWDHGPSTVREVHETLTAARRRSYNTTLKLMQIMHEKGMVTRDESRRPQVYQASVPEGQMQQRLVCDLLERAFGGSARKLVAALTASDIPEQELAEIRQLLDEREEEPR